jgi:hypothetical protein
MNADDELPDGTAELEGVQRTIETIGHDAPASAVLDYVRMRLRDRDAQAPGPDAARWTPQTALQQSPGEHLASPWTAALEDGRRRFGELDRQEWIASGARFPDCGREGCGHQAWAHGDQSGHPRPDDPCHAAVVQVPETRDGEPVVFQATGEECGCPGYVLPARPPGFDPDGIVEAEIVCNHAEPFLDEQMVDACACGAILREGVVYRPEATS